MQAFALAPGTPPLPPLPSAGNQKSATTAVHSHAIKASKATDMQEAATMPRCLCCRPGMPCLAQKLSLPSSSSSSSPSPPPTNSSSFSSSKPSSKPPGPSIGRPMMSRLGSRSIASSTSSGWAAAKCRKRLWASWLHVEACRACWAGARGWLWGRLRECRLRLAPCRRVASKVFSRRDSPQPSWAHSMGYVPSAQMKSPALLLKNCLQVKGAL